MARNVSIPITNDGGVGICTSSYTLRLRLTSGGGWQALSPQYDSPILLENLSDDVEYELGVTRQCCDGNTSTEALITFTTTIA